LVTTASIVLYNNELEEIEQLIEQLINSESLDQLFLIDNSKINYLENYFHDHRIKYIHNPSNLGFGKAHNMSIKIAIELGSKFHFIVNPDINFNGDVITTMIKYMGNDNSIGMMMPQILNLDDTIQNLPKLLPSPFGILLRKVKKPKGYYNKFIKKYELTNIPQKQIYNAPVLSGCFTLLNLKAIEEIGLYDDNFFMYFEDWDLSRRMHQKYKTIYYPLVSVYHGYESGANKSFKLFKIFVHSAFIYFNKWGWIFDNERKQINKKALSQFE
jgi:GT2 family glycosyltransferase